MVNPTVIESAKKAAAYKAVDENIADNSIVGIGSGTTVLYVIQRLVELVKEKDWKITCIPTSFQARQRILSNGLTLGTLDNYPKVDCTIDGINEIDESFNIIKGGGGCLMEEKIVASCSKRYIVVADYTKDSRRLGTQCKDGLTIEVSPLAYVPVKNRIEEKFGGKAIVRMAGPANYGPFRSDHGHFFIDWHFPEGIEDWEKINTEIILMPGVLETGLLIKAAHKAYFGMPDGSVFERTPS
ncbi:ribose-5-phosphate isomerase isoform X3 [Athalia rosae]|uniref:ribose-5-phosphate isomerase isoform X3 n=1 Tax=Athalia rosae TaxID=37344 RepID=UPI0020343302|nr:ribose-5-phosphate isomerase isoform X3 [Athalia rosae]